MPTARANSFLDMLLWFSMFLCFLALLPAILSLSLSFIHSIFSPSLSRLGLECFGLIGLGWESHTFPPLSWIPLQSIFWITS